ncbi:MAG TPA: hypothetical protein VLW65_23775 [Bryobacteraceae bacterium]|nr:hypothetical protein [Bryobacteraceae bacterium]
MTLRGQAEQAAAELHEAVVRRDFALAAERAGRLGELVRQVAVGLPAREAAVLIGEACRAIESARRKVVVARARMAGRLRRLQRTAPYRAPSRASVHTWSVDA